MKEKMISHFEQEVQRTKFHLSRLVEGGYDTPYSIVDRAIARCMGVAEFCYQTVGAETEEIYNKYKKELENLLKTP